MITHPVGVANVTCVMWRLERSIPTITTVLYKQSVALIVQLQLELSQVFNRSVENFIIVHYCTYYSQALLIRAWT